MVDGLLESYDPDGYVGQQFRRLVDAGWINVWDFRTAKPSGAMCDGTDDYPAWAAARDSVPSGEQATLYGPRGAYTLSQSVTDNGRYIRCYVEAGSTFTGAGILFTTVRLYDNTIAREERIRAAPASAGDAIGSYRIINNLSTTLYAVGDRADYVSDASPTVGFDIGFATVNTFKGMANGTGMARWDVTHSPDGSSWTGGILWGEINVINRGPDMGWGNRPAALSRWVGGIRMVPEATDFNGVGTGRHILFGYTLARSGGNNADGVRARTYNGFLIEPDAVAPSGFGLYVNGSDNSGDNTQWYTAFGAQKSLRTGIDFTSASFLTNYAVKLDASDKIAWFTTGTENASILGASGYLALYPGSTGYLTLTAPDSTSTGGNARGANAVDLQGTRGAATQVASGANSVVAGGQNNTASAATATVGGGSSNTANGANSCVPGGTNNLANGQFSLATGSSANARGQMGKWAHSSGNFGANGDAQVAVNVVRVATTNNSTTALNANAGAASSTTAIVLTNNSVFAFTAEVVARDTSNNDCAMWTVEGLIKRGANAAATALVGSPTVTKVFNDAGAAAWTSTVTADTTNGALQINGTGETSKTIRWVANVRTTEVA